MRVSINVQVSHEPREAGPELRGEGNVAEAGEHHLEAVLELKVADAVVASIRALLGDKNEHLRRAKEAAVLAAATLHTEASAAAINVT